MARRALWIGAFAILLAIVVLAAAIRRPVLTLGGSDVGRLPRGLAPSDLNLLFITLDTTRADKLGCYGEKNVATPSLDSLTSGVLFERAIAPAPLTLPAHSTIFTGEPPPIHGVRDNGG